MAATPGASSMKPYALRFLITGKDIGNHCWSNDNRLISFAFKAGFHFGERLIVIGAARPQRYLNRLTTAWEGGTNHSSASAQ